MTDVRNDDQAGPRIVGALWLAFVLLVVLLLQLTGPEPALGPNDVRVTPATAAPAVPFDGDLP